MTEEDGVLHSGTPSMEAISRLCNVLSLSNGVKGGKVALLNCEDGITGITSDFQTIFTHFQEDDILTTFYRNMITSCSTPDLKSTLLQLTASLFTRFLNLLSNKTVSRSELSSKLSELAVRVDRIVEDSSFELSIKNTVHLRSLITAVICPKIAHILSIPKQCFLTSLVLESYINCISSNHYPDIKIMTSQERDDVTHSQFYHGLLLPLLRSPPVYLPKCSEISVVVFSCGIPQELETCEGDTFSFINIESGLENVFVEESIKILDELISNSKIDMICCQKVVHHRVKNHLRKKGLIILDRLSAVFAEDLATICGTHLSPSISHANLGRVKLGGILRIARKRFLHFQPRTSSHMGVIVLKTLTKSLSEELERCMMQSIKVCNNAMSSQRLVYGGACLFTTLICNLAQGSEDVVTRALMSTLADMISFDVVVSSRGHAWHTRLEPSQDFLVSRRCSCGSFMLQNDVEPRHLTPLEEYGQYGTRRKGSISAKSYDFPFLKDNDKVLHPQNVVREVFRKMFQILDVSFKSELPVLI